MPVKKGLIPLYDAKAFVMERLAVQLKENRISENCVHHSLYRSARLSPSEELWLAVIEQALFDAHLHATGGNYHSVVWVKDAREYFRSKDFEWVCEQIGLEPDWVRKLVAPIEKLARELRGKEYDKAVVADPVSRPVGNRRDTRQRELDYG